MKILNNVVMVLCLSLLASGSVFATGDEAKTLTPDSTENPSASSASSGGSAAGDKVTPPASAGSGVSTGGGATGGEAQGQPNWFTAWTSKKYNFAKTWVKDHKKTTGGLALAGVGAIAAGIAYKKNPEVCKKALAGFASKTRELFAQAKESRVAQAIKAHPYRTIAATVMPAVAGILGYFGLKWWKAPQSYDDVMKRSSSQPGYTPQDEETYRSNLAKEMA